MKTVCFISHVPFWHRGTGGCERDLQLLKYLSRVFALKMVYLGKLEAIDVMALAKLSLNFEIHDIGTSKELTQPEYISLFESQPCEIQKADVYIVRGIENSFMLDAIPQGVPSFLDSMDLISERSRKRSEAGDILGTMTRDEEIRIFERYSQVICIQEDEAALVAQWIGDEHVILAKHPIEPRKLSSGRDRSRIGMLASHWPPNAFGLRDFVINCWPQLRRTGATLDVYGSVNERLRASIPAVTFHGFIEDIDQCYAGLGVMINPVQYGAGLKIKSIEAMAHGLPLVTSREGASGIEKMDGKALLIADTWDDFTAHIMTLMSDESRCAELSENALEYVAENLTDKACFAELCQKIESC